jgi:dipeptidyl aminopeptidase/acylaminoacyl peptidase
MYRCAVALAGVYDWEKHIEQSKNEESIRGRNKFIIHRLGDPAKNQAKFEAISPARHIGKVKIPMFVAHGVGDIIADYRQSKQLVSELIKYNVPHVAKYYSGEGHGMAQFKNNLNLYSEIEKFLADNMAPRAKPAAAPGTP